MIKRILLAALFVLSAAPALAAPDASETKLAREIFRLSGLEAQFATFGPSIEQQFRAEAGALPATVQSQLVAAVRSAFDAKTMKADAFAHLQANMNVSQARASLQWLQTPAVVRITKLEEAASQPDQLPKLQSYAASLGATPPDPARVALLQRLDRATRASAMMTSMMSTVALASGKAALSLAPGAVTEAQLEQELAAQRPAMLQQAQNYTMVSFLYTYSSLSDAELDAYLTFVESETGQWYQRVLGDALELSVRNASTRFGGDLAKAMQGMRHP